MNAESATQTGARFPQADFVALGMVLAFALVTLVRCLAVDNSVVFHDEYVYKISGDRLVDQPTVIGRGLAPQIPNRLFLRVYGLTSEFGSNAYLGAQFLNVLFLAMGLWALYRLAQRTGLSDTRALGFLGAAALLPLSAYAKYFMPEAMFFGLFCVAAYALLTGVLRRGPLALFLGGAVMGSMYFVKPHAAPLIAATAFYLLLLPDRVGFLAWFIMGVGTTFGLGKLLTRVPEAQGSSLGAYREMLDGLLAKLTTHADFQHGLGKDLLEVGAGHGLFLLCAFGLSALVAVSVLVPALKLREADRPVTVELRRLTLFLVVVSAALVGMAVLFTVLVGEVGRVHSRYYFFLYPLALLVLFHLPSVRLTLGGKIAGLVLVVTGATLMLQFGRGYSEVLPISVVSDGPEWGFVFFSKNVFFAILGAFALTGTWAVLQPRRAPFFIAALCVASVISGAYVTNAQKTIYRGPFTTGREAVTVETFLGHEAMNTALVLGENRDVVSKFLFFLTTAPFAQQLPAGTNLGELLPGRPEITSVILLSDAYVLPPELRCTLQFPGVKVCLR